MNDKQGQADLYAMALVEPHDFESPQHFSECHLDSAIPGYIEDGRFVFFYLPTEF